MFSNPRPVPSKAALRRLYQLAYISSGTAVGVATLCAEERRRRTVLVQKIADNAKRIRESPRYVHNKARKAVDEVEGRYLPLEADATGRAHLTGLDPGDRAVRGPELASVVDAGYDQLVQRPHGRKRRRPRVSRHGGGAEEDLSRHDGGAEEVHTRRDDGLPASASRDACAAGFNISQRNQPLIRRLKSQERPILVPHDTSTLDEDTLLRRCAKADRGSGLISKQGHDRRPGGAQERPSFTTIQYVPEQSEFRICATRENIPHNRKDIESDINLFLGHAPWTDIWEESRAATLLLRLACSSSLLTESRSLILWLAARGTLEKSSIMLACESSVGMVRYHGGTIDQVWDLYLDLFSMPCFRQQPIGFRAEARIAVMIGFLRADAWEGPMDSLSVFTAKAVGSKPEFFEELKVQYEKLCSNGEFIIAAKLLCITLRGRRPPLSQISTFVGLLDHSIDLLLAQDEFVLAVFLFKRNLTSLLHAEWQTEILKTNINKQLDCICNIVDRRKTYHQLSSICGMLARYHAEQPDFYSAVMQIGPKARAVLAIACALHVRSASPNCTKALQDTLRRSLPADVQRELVDLRLADQLKATWGTTRSLSNVIEIYEQIMHTQSRSVNQSANLGPAEVALVQVCSLAQQPHRALKILASTQSNGLHTSDALSLAALTLAGQQAWETLETMMDTATKFSATVANDPASRRKMNIVIKMYARAHSANETWTFVTALINRVGFRPNIETTLTMLRELVIHWRLGQPNLIPEWLKYLRDLGIPMKLSPNMAVEIFQHYYRVNRVPHAQLMDMCKRLLAAVPSLSTSKGWTKLIKEAIGHDLREPDTRRKGRTLRSAERDLDKLLADGEILPVPKRASAPRNEETENYPQMTATDSALDAENLSNSRPDISGGQVPDMILALSRGKYDEVLAIYESSLGKTGLPSSPLALNVAVQAHIRRERGALDGARNVIEAAHDAGFAAACAMGDVLIREMRMMQPEDKKNANDLRVRVIDYYRTNDENGWPVSHHVGVSAANLLIDNRRAEHGINLLNSIYTSEWAKHRPPNMVAMVVFLKGYIALGNLQGIMWSVRKVLRDDLRVSRKFLDWLRKSPKAFDHNSHLASSNRRSTDPWILQTLKEARAECIERRRVQSLEAERLGYELVRVISGQVHAEQQMTAKTATENPAKDRPHEALRADVNGSAACRSAPETATLIKHPSADVAHGTAQNHDWDSGSNWAEGALPFMHSAGQSLTES